MNELDFSDGGLGAPTPTGEHRDNLSVTTLRQHMIAMSVAAALCGAAAATATLLVLQSAGVHAACAIGGVGSHAGVEALDTPLKHKRFAACYGGFDRYAAALMSPSGQAASSYDCAYPNLAAED